MAAEAPDQPNATDPSAPPASPHVVRAQFTSGMSNHEPVDRLTNVFHSDNQSLRRLYYFTQLRGLAGETVTYKWSLDGRVIATVSSHIGSNHWRAYSSKKLLPRMRGHWRVVLTDSDGNKLSSATITYKVP